MQKQNTKREDPSDGVQIRVGEGVVSVPRSVDSEVRGYMAWLDRGDIDEDEALQAVGDILGRNGIGCEPRSVLDHYRAGWA